MNRTNSLHNISLDNPSFQRTKSLPNIELCPARKILLAESAETKRQNSKRGKLFQKTWDKVKTIIHPSTTSSTGWNAKAKPCLDTESPRMARRTQIPKLTKYETAVTSSTSTSEPCSPRSKLATVFDYDPVTTSTAAKSKIEEDQLVRNYEKLQKRLSDELHQSVRLERRGDEGLSEEFKKRLQQWDMWKASTGKSHYTPDELQKLIPSDFSKKLAEWEDLKAKSREKVMAVPTAAAVVEQPVCRRNQKKRSTDELSHQKELAWLEKQLEKVELEKKRLEREMKKYCEREARLEKLREALKNSPGPNQEFWIKTPTAECKVEGIDEKFAKKLFKWEERQGIEPECSTMALLNPKYYTPSPEVPTTHDPEMVSPPTPERDLEDHEKCRTFSSSDESDADVEEESEEAAIDSFQIPDQDHDEGASGASNTDSECLNSKPNRRRSSCALSTPLSARSPSLSGCTSEDDDNTNCLAVSTATCSLPVEIPMPATPKLATTANASTNTSFHEKHEDKERSVLKVKPILVGAGETEDVVSNIIVQTKRTIFAPVVEGCETATAGRCEPFQETIKSPPPSFLKSLTGALPAPTPPPTLYSNARETIWRKVDPPRVVGVVRKGSSYDMPSTSTKLNLNSVGGKDLKRPFAVDPLSRPNFPKMGYKIPAWCSPLMARRKYQVNDTSAPAATAAASADANFRPSTDFTIDKFLQQTNLIQNSTSSTGMGNPNSKTKSASRDLTDLPCNLPENCPVRLMSLVRSNSLQGSRLHGSRSPPFPLTSTPGQLGSDSPRPQSPIEQQSTTVTKSKSTGSVLGVTATGLANLASKFGFKTTDQKCKMVRGNGQKCLAPKCCNNNK